MPSAVKPAAPADVMPQVMASAFSEDLRLESLVNNYADGSSDRFPLALNPRRVFKLTRSLTASQWPALFDFYKQHIGKPFYFYVPRETIPPFTWDATGAKPEGRCTVVFDGSWNETTAIPRGSVSFSLREVA